MFAPLVHGVTVVLTIVKEIVSGFPAVPVAPDGRPVLMTPDGSRVITVAEWMAKTSTEDRKGREGKHLTQPSPQSGEGMPLRNPFLRKFWNLTEQMRLQKNDPQLAVRLKAAA